MANKKQEQLDQYKTNSKDQSMTTNNGVKITEDENTLTVGERGPSLLEDFHMREKLMHFDQERIPERVVHARGFGAHGEFQLYKDLSEYTSADFLTHPEKTTPVFVRFSTVQGSKGSPDTVRDVRGFATKFYTDEGNYDLVGIDFPVFFIQDGIKFPDMVHAVKPEPHNEMPQAGTAHDTFWDFFAQNPEATHMAFWAMSDRGIPKNYRQLEGFGVHTFRLVNSKGESHFVKFHWKPVQGLESFVWDEAQTLSGKDIDFHRKDLYESIDKGDYPEYELGLQILSPEQEFDFDFDILDPTKIWPEDEIPVQIVGKMTLNKNVDNVFDETEQSAFHPGNIVPGIDFSDDPLLQGRLFSYTDTLAHRLGGPNFNQIPINQPVADVHNNQRDAQHQSKVHEGQTNYHINALNNNDPHTTTRENGGFEHFQEKVEGHKIRKRSESFKDYYTQPKLYLNSLTEAEYEHTLDGFSFELGKCASVMVKQNAVNQLNKVDHEFAKRVADNIGVEAPTDETEEVQHDKKDSQISMEKFERPLPGHSVAVLVNGDIPEDTLKSYAQTFADNKFNYAFVGTKAKNIDEDFGVTETFDTAHPTLFDSLIVLSDGETLEDPSKEFAQLSFKHKKPLVFNQQAANLFENLDLDLNAPGVKVSDEPDAIVDAFQKVRYWER
ncbi:catalase [Staphylococcus auricularis]|uniref:Catalase n=1 Tax=Staphylococcus auricularis TaxID=29379 RepID=A0AAP8PMU6_9STAP|nr:catalase [Staphylococcus auricularis]MBM0868432.1 catalase HPII [Staphylococcus auricularis]MCG7342151.1 catalase [Staphylococcus auricularis]MDC6327052.1 catalase [Staphylococcus auricularis]MDN4533260.1 catalase [Staphylococcus auricularis]PNZ66284.1 catalase HPII [Staphylococcus auricularis]